MSVRDEGARDEQCGGDLHVHAMHDEALVGMSHRQDAFGTVNPLTVRLEHTPQPFMKGEQIELAGIDLVGVRVTW
jgi:hypothetical protein